MSKTALVVSGGGSKGAFAVGAIRHLIETMGIRFDIVAGTSTGSIIAPLVVTGDTQELVSQYTGVQTSDIVRRRNLTNIMTTDSIFDVQPFVDRLGTTITDARAAAILASPTQMFITTVCLQTSRLVYFQTGPAAQASRGTDLIRIGDRRSMLLAIIASANMPALMPPIQYPPNGATAAQHVDGGVRERAPLRIAIDNGATTIYAIVLAPETHAPRTEVLKSIPAILNRTIGSFTEDVLLHDLYIAEMISREVRHREAVKTRLRTQHGMTQADVDQLFTVPEAPSELDGKLPIELHVIRPAGELELDTLEFDPLKMTAMMEEGGRRAERAAQHPVEWFA